MVNLETEQEKITEVMGMVNLLWEIMLKVEKLKTNLDVETWKEGARGEKTCECEFCVVYLVALVYKCHNSLYLSPQKIRIKFFPKNFRIKYTLVCLHFIKSIRRLKAITLLSLYSEKLKAKIWVGICILTFFFFYLFILIGG